MTSTKRRKTMLENFNCGISKSTEGNMSSEQDKQSAFTARPYQLEILEKALDSNTIVCLGTGTGKTFISVMLIKKLQHQIKGTFEEGGKRTFFLVNTVPLVDQQGSVLKTHTSLRVGSYSGDMNVDAWDKHEWIAEFNKFEVLIMTAQILLDLLTHSIIKLSNINLIVLDECHNATKKHPYVKILEFFQSYPTNEHPRVMGLTASIINEKYRGMESQSCIKRFLEERMDGLERRMRSRCVTCSDVSSTDRYAAKPQEIVFSFTDSYSLNGFSEVEDVIKHMEESLGEKAAHYKALKKQYKDSGGRNPFDNDMASRSIDTMGIVCTVAADTFTYCNDILVELGPLCTWWACTILCEQLEKIVKRVIGSKAKKVLWDSIKTLKEIITLFQSNMLTLFSTMEEILAIEPFLTAKAAEFLRDVLLEEKKQFGELHAIVFTRRRCTAVILSKLINHQVAIDSTFTGLSSEYVLGHATGCSVSLADSLMHSTTQSAILRDFKSDKFNVLVATSVVEEGLDVRKCNMVVRFDKVFNYREYAQSKGRARAPGSKFILMTDHNSQKEVQRELKVMQTIEQVLFEKCQDRRLPTEEEIADEMEDEEETLLPTYFSNGQYDAARITRDNAVSLLNRYCAWLPSDQYSNTTPKFRYTKLTSKDDTEKYIAECMLPLNCPLPQRIYKGDIMPPCTEKKKKRNDFAKKSVCMKICQALHAMGELTDENLIPTKKIESDSEDEEIEEKEKNEGTRKSRQFYNRNIPTSLTMAEPSDGFPFDLFAINIVLVEPSINPNAAPLWPLWFNEERGGFAVFFPKQITKLPPLQLYCRAGTLQITLVKLPREKLGTDNLQSLLDFHDWVVQQSCARFILGSLQRSPADPRISQAIFVPLRAHVFQCLAAERTDFQTPLVDADALELMQGVVTGSGIRPGMVIRKTYGPSQSRLYYVTELAKERGCDVMEGKKTFAEYYQEKYGCQISDDHLLEVVSVSSTMNFNPSVISATKKSRLRTEKLVPGLCVVDNNIPSLLHMQLPCLPRMLFYNEFYLLAKQLREDVIANLQISNRDCKVDTASRADAVKALKRLLRLSEPVTTESPSPSIETVFEAMTTRQARLPFDLERLEVLGDSLLKQASTIFLFFQHADIHEGKLSKKRKQCISNKNLSRVGKSKGLHRIMCNSQFGTDDTESENKNPLTVWLPPGYLRSSLDIEGDVDTSLAFQEVQDKCIADSIEALIGVYFETGGVNLALKFMQEYLDIPCLFSAIVDKDKCRVKTDTQSKYIDFPLSQSAIRNPDATNQQVMDLYDENKLDRFEATIGYTFKDKSHLVQALTHLSYDANAITGCYQQYEFLGDAILDFLVTLHVYNSQTELNPGQLTFMRSALVNNNTFGLFAIQMDFYKYSFCGSPQLFGEYEHFYKLVTKDDQLDESFFKSPFVICPLDSDEGHQAPKVLGDLFESVAGAVFLDSGLDLLKVWQVYYKIMKPVIDQYKADMPRQPAALLKEKYTKSELSFELGDECCECTVKFGTNNQFSLTARAKNKKIAKATACFKALQFEK